MSLPRTSAAYHPRMNEAIARAFETGEFIIPTENPRALRLQFQGLRGALRKENAAEIIDRVMFLIQAEPSALILRARDAGPLMSDLEAALGAAVPTSSTLAPASAIDAAEEALARILGSI